MDSWIILFASLFVLLAGCASMPDENFEAVPAPNYSPSPKNRVAVIETDKGTITFELFEDNAPITTANFIKLAEKGFYDGLKFHRVVPGFVAQGGDPLGTGMGGSDEKIPLETHPQLIHTKGAVAMARSSDPDSASSQFYITLEAAHELDGSYAVFGHVIEGQEVAESLEVGDVMNKVSIIKR